MSTIRFVYCRRHYLTAALATAFALCFGVRSCRLDAEKSILEEKIEALTGKSDEIFVKFLEDNPEKVKEYLPAFVKVAKEKGYLKDLIANMKSHERINFMNTLLLEERNSFVKDLLKDAEFVAYTTKYLNNYKNQLGAK